ncbi:hypothetical protein [Streptomyces sp. NPDC047000]|uniref:hypothetical protein n=1 Tax=Streptomyces sp. NPDC047000 TaxID=3155474 RepID=UPI0033DC46CE
MFVDTSGRRSRVLRRIGLLVGVVCAGYAAVIVMAFMGWGTSLNPSSLLPFGNGQNSSGQGPGFEPQGGVGGRVGTPSGTPSLPSSDSSASSGSSPASSAPSASASATSTSTSSGDPS